MFKPRSAFSLAATVALLAVVAPNQPFERLAAIAAPTAFEVPTSVPSDTALKVSSGSDAMGAISDALKADFESQFSGAQVNVDAVGADQAIQSLVDGDADLAAISRPLSVEEEAQGLTAVDVTRPKIAIIVGDDNPFGDSLTSGQFAQIFRGEITDWSELGGAAGAIRLVDRPAISDTRLALAPYPVFQSAEFVTGSSAAQLDTDSTADIAKELGADGISYGLITEVENLDGVRILPMHKTMPTDLRYPFSQPFSFVYKGDASPAVAAFLGYAVGEPGQAVLKAANPLASVVNAAGSAVGAASNAVESAADAAGNAVEGATDAAGNAVEGAVGAVGNAVEGATDVAGSAVEGATDAAGDAANQVAAAASQSVGDRNPQSTSRGNLWWLLVIPAACLGLVAWGARRRQDDNTAYATADGPNLSGVGKAGVVAAAGAATVGGTAWAVAKQGGNVAKESLDNVGGVAQGGLGKVQGGLGNVGDAAKGGLGNIKGAAEQGVQGMKGGLDSAGNAVQGGLGNVGDVAKGGLGKVQGGLGNVGDAAKGGLGNIKGAAEQGVQGMKGGLDSASNAVQDGLGSVGDGLKSGVTGGGNTLQGCADAVTGKVGDMGNVAKNAVNDSAKGANSLWQRVRDGVSQAGDKVDDLKGQASDVADDLKDLGK